jgi:hypothetical protein
MQRWCLPAILQQRDDVIAWSKPQLIERSNERGNPAVPVAVGQARVTVHNGERVPVTGHSGSKARAKIKHRTTTRVRSAARIGAGTGTQ